MVSLFRNKKALVLWFLITAGVTYWCVYLFYFADDKSALLPGVTTHGHHQIEMECAVCHTGEKQKNVFTSSGVPSSACIQCHGESLERHSDSHPLVKFKNPENAIYLEHINARDCLSCHQEHNQKITGEMAVTVPKDYCAHCHQDVLKTYPSHQGLAFDSCATAGCHNYHDNIALAPSYLLKHYGEKDILEEKTLLKTTIKERLVEDGYDDFKPLAKNESNEPNVISKSKDIVSIKDHWHQSSHAQAGVNCNDCHQPEDSPEWIEKPKAEQCNICHTHEVYDYKQGKHGMRLAHKNLTPMTPATARIPMHETAGHKALDCNACHQTHKYDAKFAAYNACIQCHDDEHTRNYTKSKHYKLWKNELSGNAEEYSGVSCATCHMPRVDRGVHIVANHDQSSNLRPNEKMLREVCTNCHGLQFAMNSITDEALIKNNFSEKPTKQHPGIQWSVDSAIRRGDKKVIEMKKFLESLEDNPTNTTNIDENTTE